MVCLNWQLPIQKPISSFFHTGPSVKKIPRSLNRIRIRIKAYKYFNPLFLSSRKYDPVPDPDLDFYPSRTRGQKGTGSRICNTEKTTVLYSFFLKALVWGYEISNVRAASTIRHEITEINAKYPCAELLRDPPPVVGLRHERLAPALEKLVAVLPIKLHQHDTLSNRLRRGDGSIYCGDSCSPCS